MKLWLDTDPGVDDALALALILGRPEFELVGLSTVFGNASVAQTTRNAQGLLSLMGHARIPVHSGASEPLLGASRFAPEVHGGDGLGGLAVELPEAREAVQPMPAAQAIVAASHQHDQLHLVPVGPLTNMAAALRLDPTLPERIASITVMGGAFGLNGHSGNVTPAAEANIHNDARAAAEVLAAPWQRLRVVGLEATHAVPLSPDQLRPLQSAGAVGRLLWRAVQPYIDFYAQCYGKTMLVAHDATAVAALLVPDAFHWRRGPLRVVEGGLAHGQTLQDWQLLGDANWRSLPAHEVATAVDEQAIAALCLRAWTSFPKET
jgi:purine nucleosidase